ncbi:hypothetical protein [Nonomuraea sp. NPDC049684]|uniref:hypothetical protein n=1 Tax=Nonomuraea sp. NPDC049684 TaxID=3364356 RepID=UPI0037B111B9
MGLLFGGHGALALEIAIGARLAQLLLGAGLQSRGGGRFSLRGDQGQAGVGRLLPGGLGVAFGGLGPSMSLAAVVLGAFAGEVGVGGRGPQGFGVPVELAPGLLQRGGRPLLLGLGLLPLTQGVVAGLMFFPARLSAAFLKG